MGAGISMDGSTAELGNITPVIIVPGSWSRSQLRYQAEHIAAMAVNNVGLNCAAARILVTSRNWPQREEFLGYLADTLRERDARHLYYPGAERRMADVLDRHPAAQRLGAGASDSSPWILITGLDATDTDEPLFREEFFGPVLAEVVLGTESAEHHLYTSVEWVNGQLWGDLCAAIIIDAKSTRRRPVRNALESAVSELRYGTVAVNHWPAITYALGSAPWGAWGGAGSLSQSGVGFVHNSQMFSDIEKVVLRGPFRSHPKPIWFPGHGDAYEIGRRLTAFQARPSLRGLGAVMLAVIGAVLFSRSGVARPRTILPRVIRRRRDQLRRL
ncbi:hypothetical protein GCM10011591_39360 [Nocardia camponoti]|uniref:Aldehyde dehydrogenase domain-containing protein n=1 Tax=Nocardia camponoti TaxID=1616106 RepID=A0A917VCR2_9NOCA|nr:hypothetical protein GCM10011591_39360 [Nocardia camponoti]